MNFKNIKKSLLVLLPVAAIVLEIVPYGAVLNFANPEGAPCRKTYSYFSLTPFGYANFGPFITAILTCVLLVLIVVYLFKPRKGLNTAIMNVSGFATAASLMPWMFGMSYITVIGVLISILLAAVFGVCFIKSTKPHYLTEEELKEIQKQNDDMTVIDTLIM